MYEKINKAVAIKITYEAIAFIVSIMSVLSVSVPEKAAATFPMTRDMEGRIIPAIIAENVPKNNKTLSQPVMYLKNIKNEMDCGCSSSSALFG